MKACPECGSQDVLAEGYSDFFGEVRQLHCCKQCNAVWAMVYVLYGLRRLRDRIGRPVDVLVPLLDQQPVRERAGR